MQLVREGWFRSDGHELVMQTNFLFSALYLHRLPNRLRRCLNDEVRGSMYRDKVMSFQEDGTKEAVKSAFEIYKDNVRISALLDDKAQKTGGLAGLFLAAAFGFVKTNSTDVFDSVYGHRSGLLVIAAIILFISCLAACLSVMWIRGAPLPLGLAALRKMLMDLSLLPEEEITNQVRSNFYLEQLSVWEKILSLQRAINQTKGKRLFLAQILVGAGMMFVAVLLIGVIVHTSWR
jgi:hypothetical protein